MNTYYKRNIEKYEYNDHNNKIKLSIKLNENSIQI